MVSQLDHKQYNENELIEIKMPLNMPYLTSWAGYERYDGEIEIAGVHYNYVKRKVQNDTLFLLCLPNKNKTELYSQQKAYASQVNDPSSDKSSNLPLKKSIPTIEYISPITNISFLYVGSRHGNFENLSTPALTSFFIDIDCPPPNTNC